MSRIGIEFFSVFAINPVDHLMLVADPALPKEMKTVIGDCSV